MTSVGSYEAKTHLPQLLDRVAKGEKITITNSLFHKSHAAVFFCGRG